MYSALRFFCRAVGYSKTHSAISDCANRCVNFKHRFSGYRRQLVLCYAETLSLESPGLCDFARLGSFNILKNISPPIFARPKILFEKKKSTFFQKFPKICKKFPSFFGRKNENSDASWQSSAASLTSTDAPNISTPR